MIRVLSTTSLLLALLGLSALCTADAAIFPAKGAVMPLTRRSWPDKLKDGNLAIVAFTAPWCGHCRNMAPEFQKAAESLSPLIPFYNIDCDENENKALCASEDVKGYPTVKAYTKSPKGRGRTFERERKAGPIIEWASDQIPSGKVKKLKSSSEISAWRSSKPDLVHALLIHPSNPSLPLMWKVLSDRLSDKVHFGFIKDEKAEARGALGINSKDKKVDDVKVVTWTVEGEQNVYNAGPLKFEPLLAFLQSLCQGEVLAGGDAEYITTYETTVITETATESAPPAPTEDKAAKLREQKAKWEEEERRDRIRREKREQDRLARLFEEQERVTDEEDAQEDSGPQVVSRVTPAAQPDAAQSAVAATTEEPSSVDEAAEPLAPMEPREPAVKDDVRQTGDAGHQSGIAHAVNQSADTPLEAAADDFEYGESKAHLAIQSERSTEDPIHQSGASHADDQSADTPLEAATDEFEHGLSEPSLNKRTEESTKESDQSAETPLAQESEDFETGQHEAVWDESATEDRVRDEL